MEPLWDKPVGLEMLQRLVLYIVDPELECYMLSSSQSGLLNIVGVYAPVFVQNKLCILF